MKKILFLLLFPVCLSAQNNLQGVDQLALTMTGSFNSSQQAKLDTNYLNIRLDMTPIWLDRVDGKWLYVEQAINKENAKPYRQRVYHLQKVDEKTFSSTIYQIDSAKKFVGYHKNLTGDLTYSMIKELEGCTILLTFDGKKYKGQTKKGACKSSWGKAAYATSEVEIYDDKLISWDRGWNEKDEYVWGAENAGYIFIKQKSP